MPKFVGLMTFPRDAESTGEATESGIDRYFAWQEELRASGRLIAAAGLDPESRVVRAGTMTDGPFTEASEIVAGYLVVEAADLDEAAKLFETHPIAVDGVGMFVVSEIALELDTPREEHLSRFERS
ncbi:YciI family protein [Amycolatopsis orientalis]|uniref:YciI family protein n=1 Tax=Amycolatopsis orientalis TaxID=31958 RepID=UPI0003F9266E|nr:YciI family protein [Amycolatopsis orientalis]